MLTVGIDVGGTKTACVVTDAEDRILLREVETTDQGRLPDQLSSLARRAIERFVSDATPGSVAAVGVAIPGHVEPRTGTATLAVNLGGADLSLGSELEQSVGLPCYGEHDARAAATWLQSRSGTAADMDTPKEDLARARQREGVGDG